MMTISMTATTSKTLWLAPLSAALLMLAGCSNSADPVDSTATDTTTAEAPISIKIATESSYKPFSYTDADGKLIGYEVELVDALCAQMQAECEMISQDWDGLIPGLNAQKFDAVIAGMSITPERQEVVEFTDPYFYTGIILIGKKGDDISVASLDAQPIASQRATVASQYLHREKVELAATIARDIEAKFGSKGRVHFNVGGAQAVEDSLKIVRNASGGKSLMFAFEGGCHGRTLGASAITSSYRYRRRYGHFGDRAQFIEFPYHFRGPRGMSKEEYGELCVARFARLFETIFNQVYSVCVFNSHA